MERDEARPPRCALLTLGCKLNQAETESIARDLTAAGWEAVDRAAPADAFVINSCAVTHVAARKSRHLVRLARRLSPDAKVVVTGCYAELEQPNLLLEMGASRVVRNEEKAGLADCLQNGQGGASGNGECAPPFMPRLRTRSFVKAQEGCDDVCAFCVVPRTRGRQRSVPLAEVVESVRRLESEGVQEVVVTGTQLGAYGLDQGDVAFPHLIRVLLSDTSVPRLRLSSLQPGDVTPDLLELWQDGRLCRHFHLALQSGSYDVLRRMRRRYDVEQFRAAVEAIHAALPDAAVTTDVMVGFPGESDAQFEETYRLCATLGFAALHVFPFSKRAGTVASKMPQQVLAGVKRERTQRMLALGRELSDAFQRRFVGREMGVLWETGRPGGNGYRRWEGLTDNYIRVFAESPLSLENRLTPARLTGRFETGIRGEVIG